MRRRYLPNVPVPHGLQGADLWHGVAEEAAGWEILERRLILPRATTSVKRRGFTASLVDRVYLTTRLHYALYYSRGHAMVGAYSRLARARPGWLFHVADAALGEVEPDEDAVGDLVERCSIQTGLRSPHAVPYGPTSAPLEYLPRYEGCVAFDAFAKRVLTPHQYDRAAEGSVTWKAQAGKKLLRSMSDPEKLAVILWDQNGRVAHIGPVAIDGAWRIDRRADFRSLGDTMEEAAPRILEMAEQVV